MKYVISVGTNIANRLENLNNAAKALKLLPKTTLEAYSCVYETEPIGYQDQQSFYNAVFVVESELEPSEMLGACLGIEAGLGRVRLFKDGPRIIDLDIIFAQDKIINEKNLTVPHPRYHQRRFVLEPLFELFPGGNVFGYEIKKYLPQVSGQEIKKLSKTLSF